MTPETQHIGTLRGKVLIFGGVYSNYQALEELYQLATKENIPPQNIICTGDIAGYCASPVECLDFLEDWGIRAIQGNVEQNLLNGTDDCGCNFSEGSRCDFFAKQWFPYTAVRMTRRNLNYLATLPLFLDFEYAQKRVKVLHGSMQNISEFVFKSTPWDVKAANFEVASADVILAGHCGLPFADAREDKLWLNAGVIGMPANDGTPRVWYVMLDDANETFSYEFRSFEYDAGEANQLMMENGLPYSYSETLLTGLWDNCDILPDEETALQGVAIEL